MKADYSEFLTPAQLEHEEQLWATCGLYQKYADIAWKAIADLPIPTRTVGSQVYREDLRVLEIGCGTGWVPHELRKRFGPHFMNYTGVDKNPGCVARAATKTPQYAFHLGDVRSLVIPGPADARRPFDLVMTWAVLKHFGLGEWDWVFAKILAFGKVAAFTLPITDQAEAIDDGIEFPHVRIPLDRVKAVAASAGHRIVEIGQLDGEAEHWFITRKS